MQTPDSVSEWKPSSAPARWGAALAAAASAAVLVMHGYLGTYSRFMADDYCSAAESVRLGILRAAWFWYRTWTGRYSANVLDAIFGALGPGATPIVTILVLLLWLASLFAAALLLCARRDGGHSQPLPSFSIASTILFITLALSPTVPQSLYWGQGMRSVIPPLIILTCDAALFLYSSRRRWSRQQAIFWMAASFILAFGAGGFSETYAALQVVIFSLALALVILVGRRRAADSSVRFAAAGLAGAILSVLVIIISPGNAARAASFPPRPGPLGVMGISAQSYASFFSQIASSPLNILALAAATGFGLWIGLHTSIGPRGWRTAAFVLMAGLILTFSCFPPAAYGQSSAPPNRTLVIPTYLLVLTAVFLGIAVSPRLAARWKFLAPFSYVSILLLWLAAVLSLSQMFAVRPTYIAYAHAWARFNSQMISFRQAGVATAVISTADQKANNWAGLNTLGDTTRFWLNKCVGDYYGVKVISTTP